MNARDALDAIDRRILHELQRDARLSTAEIAERVGTSTSPCWRRIRQMEQDGIIRSYVALLDPPALGLPVSVFVTTTSFVIYLVCRLIGWWTGRSLKAAQRAAREDAHHSAATA